jgi:hypothetical protein
MLYPHPPSTDRPGPSHVGSADALSALESADYLEVRAILARIDTEIDAKALLDQLDKPQRPGWQTIIDDWVSVKVPRPVFEEWNAQRQEWDHLYFEYNPSTELMLIKCMTSPMHVAVPTSFITQAVVEISKLSQAAQKTVHIGTTQGMFSYDS